MPSVFRSQKVCSWLSKVHSMGSAWVIRLVMLRDGLAEGDGSESTHPSLVWTAVGPSHPWRTIPVARPRTHLLWSRYQWDEWHGYWKKCLLVSVQGDVRVFFWNVDTAQQNATLILDHIMDENNPPSYIRRFSYLSIARLPFTPYWDSSLYGFHRAIDYHGTVLHRLTYGLHRAIDTPARAATVQYIITLTMAPVQ